MDKNRLRDAARNNIVTIMFIVLCAVCMAFSGYAPNYVLYELFGRLSRNMFIVLSLIIPIVAGMGINFAITIGAMAAQIACLLVLEWGVPGIGGLALAALLTVPLGGVFGFLIGKLLNRMKGQEMIGSMILGYFANGLYQLLFLFIFDNIIPIHNPNLTIKGSTGIANTMDLSREGGFAYSLEKLWQLPASQAALVFAAVAAVLLVTGYLVSHRRNAKKLAVQLGVIAAAAAVMQFPAMKALFSMVSVPMATFGVVALLCLFNVVIMRTRLGQQLRAVGQSGVVANAAGIDVDHVRIIAIVFSTILAGWGQLIFVQNMGSFQTYGAHEQVGLYAGAAILVGGASVIRATNTQALVGCVLFHLMFILAPAAGKNLFGDAAIGEYFRVFICYGVIALALVMHAWSENSRRKQAASALRAGGKAYGRAQKTRAVRSTRLGRSAQLFVGLSLSCPLDGLERFPRRFEPEEHFEQTVAETIQHQKREHDGEPRRAAIRPSAADVNVGLEADFPGLHIQFKIAVSHVEIYARQVFRDGQTAVFVGGEGDGGQRGKIILAHEHGHLRRLHAAMQLCAEGENAAARLLLKACVDIGKHEKLAQHVCDRLRIRHGDASVRVTINHAVNSIPRSGERCQTRTKNDGKQYKLS